MLMKHDTLEASFETWLFLMGLYWTQRYNKAGFLTENQTVWGQQILEVEDKESAAVHVSVLNIETEKI